MKYNKTNNSNENSNATRKAASVNRSGRKAVQELKAAIKATEFQEIELSDYGIQIFAAYLDDTEYHEYYVIIKAGRDIITGRYYLITREGLRIWWGRLDQNTQQHAAADFLDAIEREQQRRDNNPQSTTTATEPENEPQPAPSFWGLFADYAAGTWHSITTRAPKCWHAITTAASRVFWWLLLLFCVLSAFAVFVVVLNLLSTTTPRLWVRWLFILPSAAVAGVYTYIYIKIVDATTDARRYW